MAQAYGHILGLGLVGGRVQFWGGTFRDPENYLRFRDAFSTNCHSCLIEDNLGIWVLRMSEIETAFLRLVRPCRRRLHFVARHYAGSAEDARDLVQETLLRAWRAYNPGEDRSYGEGWLFVIQRRVAAEWARQGSRRVTLVPIEHEELTELVGSQLSEPLEALPSSTEDQFREFLDQNIAAAFDSLEPAYREVVLLSVAADLSYREIAEVIGCPLGTVMSRMARARRALRERLAGVAKAKGWKVGTPQAGEVK